MGCGASAGGGGGKGPLDFGNTIGPVDSSPDGKALLNSKKSEENIVVAVRLRPYNQREKDIIAQGGKKCCIKMPPNQPGKVVIFEDDDPTKNKDFDFDYAYWSHDKEGGNFVDQDKVMDDLGNRYLDNVFKGFNCSLFAYGQTGAGKSFTMTGTKEMPGILPRGCREMFRRIAAEKDITFTYRVMVSYMEIYNEQVRDLLSDKSEALKVREDPHHGFYVEFLTSEEVKNYEEMEKYMAIGESHRTVAATSMNAESSRSHSIFRINFEKVSTIKGKHENVVDITASEINLVDLAGSERSDKTGATGQRLAEANNINKSLSTLGAVITALAESKKNDFIPYRNSQLTKLLKNSLGGNAKTIMVAAISPSHDNFEETLSTLRYAWKVKSIKTVATKNKKRSAAQIEAAFAELQVLRAENVRLQSHIANLEAAGAKVSRGGKSGACTIC
mmetsp:Transcript_28212/g.55504  ORF Transcript_28212/g.55504 Transcript_28212/m.55504 type:complete len:445 (-) Transcript_28212:459-1793(-)